MNSKQLFERSKMVSPGGVHSPVRAFKSVGGDPIFFRSAQGAYITSVEGKRYIDFCQSFGPNILGHRDADVQSQVQKMLDTAWSLGACEPYSLELAEWMTQNIPWLECVRFVCSGTEAVMSALRVARAVTGKNKILKFDGCYHGHFDGMLVKAGSGLAGETASDSAGVPEDMAHSTLIAPLDDETKLEQIVLQHKSDLAAIILEPLPANFGLLPQRKEFISKIFELARSVGALVIFDEVISGFRVGTGGMAEDLAMQPDLVTYGKVMGGGFPVGCYGGKWEYMRQVAPMGPVYQAGTLAANPVGMVAGLATLKKMQDNKLYSLLNEKTRKFCDDLNAQFKHNDFPLQLAYKGSLFWLHINSGSVIRSPKDFSPNSASVYYEIFHKLLEQGVYLAPSAFEVGFVSVAHTEEILQEASDAFIKAAAGVKW